MLYFNRDFFEFGYLWIVEYAVTWRMVHGMLFLSRNSVSGLNLYTET